MTEPIGIAEGRPFTVHDLEAMPEDGRRYELDEQRQYALEAAVSGDEVFAARRPFPMQICPARLLDGLRPR